MNIFSDRLKSARTMAGFSMDDLSTRSGLSKNAISRYEKGTMKPDSSNLIKLSNALNVKADYFFRPFTVHLNRVEFRKKAKIGQKQLTSIQQRIIDRLESYIELESLVAENYEFTNPLAGFPINHPHDGEDAARKIRVEWQLGLNPLSSITELLEDNKIKVIEVDENNDFDGLSSLVDDAFPVIVVNKNFTVERKRFTLLHELGHLLLEMPGSFSEKEQEKICNRFAGAFLITRENMIAQLSQNRNKSKISLNEFIAIQKEWGISIRAIMARARDLEIINESRYKQFCITVNSDASKKEKVDEPRFSLKEESLRFDQLLYKALAMEQISYSKAASIANKPIHEIKESLSYL